MWKKMGVVGKVVGHAIELGWNRQFVSCGGFVLMAFDVGDIDGTGKELTKMVDSVDEIPMGASWRRMVLLKIGNEGFTVSVDMYKIHYR